MNLKEETIKKIMKCVGPESVLEQEPMKLHTSMEVGGPAAYFIQPESEEALVSLVRILKEEEIPFYIKGNGSNLIVRDCGYDGVMIETTKLNRITTEGSLVTAQCGALLKEIAKETVKQSLSGFEFASGIPGSLGGAITMNAGAYDGEMKDIVKEVVLLDKDGTVVTKAGAEMDFSYRHSLCSGGDFIVLSATFLLVPGKREEIQEKIDDLSRRREEKQPLEYPSCGSTFKRPEGYFAGKLITDAGLKGFQLGGAQVSEKHAGFIINRDNASAGEILALIRKVQETVKEKFGVELVCEVKVI